MNKQNPITYQLLNQACPNRLRKHRGQKPKQLNKNTMLHEPQQQPRNSLKPGPYRGLNKSLNKKKRKASIKRKKKKKKN
jgi:hypothetical protein